MSNITKLPVLSCTKYTAAQARELLKSISKHLDIDEPKLYIPAFLKQQIYNNTASKLNTLVDDNNTLVDDNNTLLDDEDNIDYLDDNNCESAMTITHMPLASISIDDDTDTTTECNEDIDGGICTPYIRSLKNMELVRNCLELDGNVINSNNTENIDTESINVFCKISPLLPPISFIRDMDQHSDLSRYPLEPYYQQLIKNDNSAGNVELIALYLLSNLTFHNLAPGFPIFYGGATGRSAAYFYDISDEIPDFKDEWWFCEATRNGELDLCYVSVKDILNDGIDDFLDDDSDFLDSDEDNSDEDTDVSETDSEDNNITTLDDPELTSVVAENIDNILSFDEDLNNIAVENTNSSCNTVNCEELDLNNIDNMLINDTSKNDQMINNDNMYFLKLKNYPVSIAFMEPMDHTLDELLTDGYEMTREEWISILFQTAYNMAVANHCYGLVHNDLHNQNIMLDPTDQPYLYFCVNGVLHKVPTFGRIVKIIDFARSTFSYNGNMIMSDMFAPNGEAEGQYTYIPYGKTPKIVAEELGYNSVDKLCLPNPSFDMVYLAYTIMSDLEEDKHADIIKMLRSWSVSDLDGSNILDKDCDFEMYVDIAHNCHNAVPIKLLESGLLHDTFKVNEKDKQRILDTEIAAQPEVILYELNTVAN